MFNSITFLRFEDKSQLVRSKANSTVTCTHCATQRSFTKAICQEGKLSGCLLQICRDIIYCNCFPASRQSRAAWLKPLLIMLIMAMMQMLEAATDQIVVAKPVTGRFNQPSLNFLRHLLLMIVMIMVVLYCGLYWFNSYFILRLNKLYSGLNAIDGKEWPVWTIFLDLELIVGTPKKEADDQYDKIVQQGVYS